MSVKSRLEAIFRKQLVYQNKALGISKWYGQKYFHRPVLLDKPVNIPFSTIGNFSTPDFIFSTSKLGLCRFQNNRLTRLTHEPNGFGITKCKTGFLYFEKVRGLGRIVFLQPTLNQWSAQVVKWGFNGGIHQILFEEDSTLIVIDTYRNSILKYDDLNLKTSSNWTKNLKEFFPNGKLKRGRSSENYNHFNSILPIENGYLILAHNETLKTGKYSEIWQVDKNFQVLKITPTNSSNAHNLMMRGDNILHLNSLKSSLIEGNESQKLNGDFHRGLIATQNGFLVASSPFGNQEERKFGEAHIFLLNHNFQEQGKLTICNTQISDLYLL